MKRLLIFGLACLLLMAVPPAANANPKQKRYASCSALNKDHPRGITYSKRWQSLAVKAGYLGPKIVKYNLYDRNYHLESSDFRSPVGTICPVKVPVAPSPVQYLSATRTLKNQILLTWVKPAIEGPSPLVFDVYRDGVKIIEGLTTNSFTDTGLQDGVTQTYEVVARNPIGESRLSVTGTTAAPVAPVPTPSTPSPSGTRYANCDAARAAGVTPIRRGTSLYDANRHLDRDGDGIACE